MENSEDMEKKNIIILENRQRSLGTGKQKTHTEGQTQVIRARHVPIQQFRKYQR